MLSSPPTKSNSMLLPARSLLPRTPKLLFLYLLSSLQNRTSSITPATARELDLGGRFSRWARTQLPQPIHGTTRHLSNPRGRNGPCTNVPQSAFGCRVTERKEASTPRSSNRRNPTKSLKPASGLERMRRASADADATVTPSFARLERMRRKWSCVVID